MNRALQLFSPTFIQWLANLDDRLAFELEDGMLTCIIGVKAGSAAALDRLCENAAHVAGRIAQEAAESAPAAPATFDARGALTPAHAGAGSARATKRAIAAAGVVLVLGVVGFNLVSKLDTGSDETATSAAQSAPATEPVATDATDAALLAAIKREGDADGVDPPELYDEGIEPFVVTQWWQRAEKEGLIEPTPNQSGMVITKKGEKRLAELEG
jgi:hypothetical protein